MQLERLIELVRERPEISIRGDKLVREYEFCGKQKYIHIPIVTLLTLLDGHEAGDVLITETLNMMVNAPKDDYAVAAADVFPDMCKMAARYKYMRDVLFRGARRGDDMPNELSNYFYEVIDVKYPTAEHFDTAIDDLMERDRK